MQVVTFETAKRLKDAGFPQPKKLSAGQIAYDIDGLLLHLIGSNMHESEIFAPTATDILSKLGGDWSLVYDKLVGDDEYYFFCESKAYRKKYMSKNPAEACAAAWLAINEKPGTDAETK